MQKLLGLLFRCRHKRMSFPLTIGERTWQSCLDCGTEVEYHGELAQLAQMARLARAGARVAEGLNA